MKVLDRIFAGERPVIFGDGSQVYDFIHVDDVARANVLGMKADCADENFNIGMGMRHHDQRAGRSCCSSSPVRRSSPSTGRTSRVS